MNNTNRNGINTRSHAISPVIVSGIICLLLYLPGWLTTIENHLHDNESFLTRKTVNSDIVIIEIDHSSIKELEEWPWPRRHYAKVIENLLAKKARAIFVDIDFSSSSNPVDDAILATSLKKYKAGTILMPSFMQYSNSSSNKYLTLIEPNIEFRKNITTVSVNLKPDADGLVRQINLRPEFAGQLIPTAATIFNNYAAETNEKLKLNLSITPASFQHISFYKIYNDDFDPELIKDKFVIIGATALELSDQIALPVYQSLAGPVVQAIAAQTLVSGKLTTLDKTTTTSLLILTCILIWRFPPIRNWRKSLLLLAITNLSLLILSITLHINNIILIEVVPFILLTTLSFVFFQLSRIDKQIYKILNQRLRLNKNEKMMSHVIKNTSEGIILLDAALKITEANFAAAKIFGAKPYELINSPAHILFYSRDFKKITQTQRIQLETKILSRDNILVPVKITANQLELNDEKIYTIFIHDISERKARQKVLTYQATHDSVTGLNNRSYLLSRIEDAVIAYEKNKQTATLVIIDLNKFKEINDALSHNTGDKLLITLSERLKTLENKQTFVARLGGDEFSILITDNTSEDKLVTFIAKVQNKISAPIDVDDLSITLGAAIGIAQIPEHATTTDSLLMAADVAMYKSKNNKVPYFIYEPQSDDLAKRNLAISNDIKQALSNNQLELYYQPKIDFSTNAVIGLEALIRWKHPTLGLIQPNEFIPIIENSSLIKPVTFFTIETAVKMQKKLHASGIDISIAINISANLLEDNNLATDIKEIISAHNASTKNITLEITESAAMNNHDRALNNLNKLVDAKLRLSIDDFGTSYASFSYLKQLPATELKIDKLFISNICHDESDKIITSSTISLAHGLNMQVVAEGIEDKETYEYLYGLGCDIAQGYWISKPMPKEMVADWVFQWNKENYLPHSHSNIQ